MVSYVYYLKGRIILDCCYQKNNGNVKNSDQEAVRWRLSKLYLEIVIGEPHPTTLHHRLKILFWTVIL